MRQEIIESIYRRREQIKEAMTAAGPPENLPSPLPPPPDVYDDGDPSTDPTFEDLFPFLVPKYPQSPYPLEPYPSDSEEMLPYAPLIPYDFPSIDDPTGPIKILQDIVDYFRSRK